MHAFSDRSSKMQKINTNRVKERNRWFFSTKDSLQHFVLNNESSRQEVSKKIEG